MIPSSAAVDSTDLLRHTIATLAYRAAKVLRGAPPEFSEFSAGAGTRTAGHILAHLGDLFDWALSLANGQHVWRNAPVNGWDVPRAPLDEVAVFHG